MKPFTSILVDIDAARPDHPALARAARLARRAGARLTIADVVDVPDYARHYLPQGIEQELISERRDLLTRMAGTVTGVETKARLLTGRPADAVIREVLASGHDLVVRSHGRDPSVPTHPYGVVDMDLLRKCPCPVLLVQRDDAERASKIAGAVKASTEDPNERALNARIVEHTLLMAELEECEAVLLQAWAPFGERVVREHASPGAYEAYVEDVRRRAAAELAELARSFGNRAVVLPIAHRRGEPEDVIPEFVASAGIDLVVMGTVARGGLAGWFIGNTAERVLRKLGCSVLTVKPEGFESPVRLDAA